jgi:MFS family permease
MRWAVVVLCLVQFVDVLGVGSAITAIPSILRGVSAPESSAGLVATAYATFFGALLIIGARMGDRYGYRRVLLVGVGVFGLVSVVGATATTLAQILVTRVLQGASAAISVPAALRLLLAVTPDEARRRRAMAGWSAAGGAAGATGLLVGGVLTQLLDWRAVFWINAPVSAVLVAGILWAVPSESAADRAERLDAAGATLLVVALMSIVAGSSLIETPSRRWVGAGVVAAGLLVGAAFAMQQRLARFPLIPAMALRNANLRTGTAVSFLITASTSSAAVLATFWVQDRLGGSPIRAGLELVPISVGTIAGSGLTGLLARRLLPRRLTAVGLAGIAGGILVLAATAHMSWGVPVGAAIAGVGLGIASVGANTIGTTVPPAVASSATGILNTGAQLGTAVGIAVLVLLSSLTSTVTAWTATAIAVLLFIAPLRAPAARAAQCAG